jgi:hypothetical protein
MPTNRELDYITAADRYLSHARNRVTRVLDNFDDAEHATRRAALTEALRATAHAAAALAQALELDVDEV